MVVRQSPPTADNQLIICKIILLGPYPRMLAWSNMKWLIPKYLNFVSNYLKTKLKHKNGHYLLLLLSLQILSQEPKIKRIFEIGKLLAIVFLAILCQKYPWQHCQLWVAQPAAADQYYMHTNWWPNFPWIDYLKFPSWEFQIFSSLWSSKIRECSFF